MSCYWPTKKSGKGIFIRMKPPKCLKSHCEFTMAQKSRQQGCKLITGGVTPETTQFRGRSQITETIMPVPCDNIQWNSSSEQTNVQMNCPLALKQFCLVMWGSPERHLQLFLFCWPKWMKKSGEPGSQPGPSMLSGLLLPFHMEINAAECSQLPNKWLWLLPLHTKQWKPKGIWQWHWSDG